MTACDTLKKFLNTIVQVSIKERSTSIKYQPAEVTNELLNKLLTNPASARDELVGIGVWKDTYQPLLNFMEKYKEAFVPAKRMLSSEKDPSVVRSRAIAIGIIADMQKSYHDIYLNSSERGDIKDLSTIKNTTTGLYNLDAANLEQVLGMKLLRSVNHITVAMRPEDRAELHRSIGQKAIDDLITLGVLSNPTDGFIIKNDQEVVNDTIETADTGSTPIEQMSDEEAELASVNEIVKINNKGKRTPIIATKIYTVNLPVMDVRVDPKSDTIITDPRIGTITDIRQMLFEMSDTSFDEFIEVRKKLAETNNENIGKQLGALIKFYGLFNVSRKLTKVMMPGNNKIPTNEPIATLEEFRKNLNTLSGRDTWSDEKVETLYSIHKTPLYINPIYFKYLSKLAAIVKNSESTDTLRSYLRDHKYELATIEDLLGVTSLSDSFKGKEIQAFESLASLVYNFDTMFETDADGNFVASKPLHYMPINIVSERTSYDESSINFQSDKKGSRQMLLTTDPGADVRTYNKFNDDGTPTPEYQQLLEFLVDSKINEETLKNIPLNAIESALDAFKERGDTSKANKLKGIPNSTSIFHKIKLMEILRDIAIDENTFTTNAVTFPDATTSGALIKLHLIAYDTEDSSNGFKQLQSMMDGEGDFYSEVQNHIEENMQDTALIKILKAAGVNTRDASKSPSMTIGVYNQGVSGGKYSIAKEYLELILGKLSTLSENEVNNVKNLLEEYAGVPISDARFYEEYTNKAVGASRKGRQSGEGGEALTLADIAKKKLQGYFTKYHKDIETVFNAIESLIAVNPDAPKFVHMIPPSVWLSDKFDSTKADPKFIEKFGIKLAKRKEALVGKDRVTILKDFNNLYSAYVSAIHSMDSYIELEAHRRTKTDLGDSASTEGVMTIHDSDGASLRYHALYQQHYREVFLEAVKRFDIVESLLLTAKAYNKGVMPKELLELESQMAIRKETKEKAIDELYKDDKKKDMIFGYKKVNVPITSNLVDTINKTTATTTAAVQDKVNYDAETNESYNDYMRFGSTPGVYESFYTDQDLAKFSEELQQMHKENVQFLAENPDIEVSTDPEDFTYGFEEGVETIKTKEGYDKGTPDYITGLNHEIKHAKTAAFIENSPNDTDVKFLSKNIERILDRIQKRLEQLPLEQLERVSNIMKRLKYIRAQGDTKTKVAEFVAIMLAEPVAREALLETFPERIISTVQKLWSKVKEMFGQNPDLDVDYSGMLKRIEQKGTEYRKTGKKYKDKRGAGLIINKEFAPSYTEYVGKPDNNDALSRMMVSANEYAVNTLVNRVENFGKKVNDNVLKQWHKNLYSKSSIYKNTVGAIRDVMSSELVESTLDYMSLGDFKNRKLRNDFISNIHNIMANRNETTNKFTSELDAKLQTAFTPEEISSLNTGLLYSGSWALMDSKKGESIYSQLMSSSDMKTTIDTLLKQYSKATITEAEGLKSIYIDGVVPKGFNSDKSQNEYINTAVALLTIRDTPGVIESLTKLKQHPEIHDELIAGVNALKATHDRLLIDTNDHDNTRGNLVSDYYEHNYKFELVTKQDLVKGKFTKDDRWEILREPTDRSIGIIYRRSDVSDQTGIGIDLSYNVDGLIMSEEMYSKFDKDANHNVVKIKLNKGDGYKILFTKENKENLGLVKSPAQSMYRTLAHNQLLIETQAVRNEMLTSGYITTINSKEDEDKFLAEMDNNDIDFSWFIKIGKDYSYDKLDSRIKKKFVAGDRISNIGNLNDKIDLVRKDLSYWVQGYKEPDVFTNSPLLNKTASAIRKLVLMTKLSWTSGNPVKIFNDAVSNYSYLAAVGVPLIKIPEYTNQAIKELKTLEALRGEVVGYTFLAHQDPKYKGRLEEVQKKLREHPLASVHYNGFIQSLSTDIIMKNFNTISGLQHDVEEIINKLVRVDSGKGELNEIGKFILSTSKKGPRVEELLGVLADKIQGTTVSNEVSGWMKNVGENLAKIKEDEDVARYLTQVMPVPGSELIKLGSAAVQYADVIPRIILFKHLKNIGKSEKEAVLESIEAFVDYKVNMPKELKVVSDYGILLFPSFWLRIQRVIMNLGRKHPVNFGTSYAMTELLGTDSMNILGQNIFSKLDSGILHTPYISLDSLLLTSYIPGS
jgi:hypothetical protein